MRPARGAGRPAGGAGGAGGTLRDVLSVDLAKQLRDAGVVWTPASGDRFVVPDRGMDDAVFVLSEMTVEVHDLPTGRVVGFNGTTEWALDSVRLQEALWLPREGQLRELLGERFVRLEAGNGRAVVVVRAEADLVSHAHVDAECAYALAVLATLRPQDASTASSNPTAPSAPG